MDCVGATTKSSVPGHTIHSLVAVLTAKGSMLPLLSQLEPLAKEVTISPYPEGSPLTDCFNTGLLQGKSPLPAGPII